MTYEVVTFVRIERDPDLLPDGKINIGKKKFPTLYAAKQYADQRIVKLKDASSVVEVRVKDVAKYRVQRDASGNIQKIPLV